MADLIGWPPILWALRITVLTLLVGTTYVFILLLSRFLRWRVVKSMLLADPPQVDTISGEAAGLKGEIRLTRKVDAQDDQIAALERGLTDLQQVVEGILNELARPEPRK